MFRETIHHHDAMVLPEGARRDTPSMWNVRLGLQPLLIRWDTWFGDMIGVTLANPTKWISRGTAWRYELWVRNCPKPYDFIVIFETAPFGGGQKGVITAYQDFL